MITLCLRVYMCVAFNGCTLHSGVYAMSSVQSVITGAQFIHSVNSGG